MLKKITALAAVILLSGCSGQSGEPDALEKSFKASLTLSEGFAAEAERVEGSGWNYTLTEPESVKGLEITLLSEGKCVVSIGEHSTVYERSELPRYAPLDLLSSALDMCIEGKGVKTSVNGEKTVRTGTVRGVGFTVTSSGGKPSEVSFNGGMTAEIS
ncbi:MAG: hypothetical protein IKP95_07015 [Ruminococcus sp.]|nr:hypothetical protein [Ruminococcus sp.]